MRMRLDPKNPKKGRTDWARVDAQSDADVEKAARADPDSRPLTDDCLKRMGRVPEVKRIRQQLSMTQKEFAKTFQLSVATLRDWEQGRYPPDQSARTLLKIIAALPGEVEAVLSRA
jgi:putative transcriptional regulator